MAAKKKKKVVDDPYTPIAPTSAEEVLAELAHRGYDDTAALSYASAARSWTEAETPERAVWKAVEAALKARMS